MLCVFTKSMHDIMMTKILYLVSLEGTVIKVSHEKLKKLEEATLRVTDDIHASS